MQRDEMDLVEHGQQHPQAPLPCTYLLEAELRDSVDQGGHGARLEKEHEARCDKIFYKICLKKNIG